MVTTPTHVPIYERIKKASDEILKHHPELGVPRLAVVLGSGLGDMANLMVNQKVVPYADIPYFHGTSIEGHKGQLVLGSLFGIPTVCMQGRFHYYEGYTMDEVVFPTRAVCATGIQTLLLTNAAGGVNTKFRPCDLMIIEDHINLMGDNPLKGKHLADLGPRFPDLTHAYHPGHISTLMECALELKLPIQKGVYAALAGPTYETPAEIRMLRTMGADAVGMSTVPECIAANHLGIQVVGMSCITNLAAGITQQKLTHDEVIQNSKNASKNLNLLLEQALPRMMKA